MKTRIFHKRIQISTIRKYAQFIAWQRDDGQEKTSDRDLIKEWWYSNLARAYLRYSDFNSQERLFLSQFGGEDYCCALRQLLNEREIFDEADDSYLIDFAALRLAPGTMKSGETLVELATEIQNSL